MLEHAASKIYTRCPFRRNAGLALRCYSNHADGRNSSNHLQRNAAVIASSLLLAGGTWSWFRKDPRSQLSYNHFTPLTIQSILPVNHETSIFTLRIPAQVLPDRALYPYSESADVPLQAIYVRQPELQIQRAYTPLSLECFAKDWDGDGSIRLLVKRYSDGEVSSYLHRLKVEDEVYVRGPVRTWTLPPCEELVFIAGGTGITPLAQLLSQTKTLPSRIKVMYASSNIETSLWRHLLPKTAQLEMHEVFGRIQLKDLARWLGSPKAVNDVQVVVCGPEGLITETAGPRKPYAVQDTIGGHLACLGWTEQNVKKL